MIPLTRCTTFQHPHGACGKLFAPRWGEKAAAVRHGDLDCYSPIMERWVNTFSISCERFVHNSRNKHTEPHGTYSVAGWAVLHSSESALGLFTLCSSLCCRIRPKASLSHPCWHSELAQAMPLEVIFLTTSLMLHKSWQPLRQVLPVYKI